MTKTREDGSAVVESVVLVPVAMLVVLLAVQACLWAYASTLVEGAASSGEQAAATFGGTPSSGQLEARAVLSETGDKIVVNPYVRTDFLAAGVVEVHVSGNAESIIPWLRLPVAATRTGLRQEFRESG